MTNITSGSMVIVLTLHPRMSQNNFIVFPKSYLIIIVPDSANPHSAQYILVGKYGAMVTKILPLIWGKGHSRIDKSPPTPICAPGGIGGARH